MASKEVCKGYSLLAIILSTLVLLSLFIIQSEAQFFTKSSKSIPRMGRRSEDTSNSELITPSQSYRHFLIDNLIDAYGPNLLENLIRQQQKVLQSDDQAQEQGEVAYKNEQPLDQLVDFNERESALYPQISRDERSGKSLKDASLAMRALNINRYLSHLESGQPLMSYERLFRESQNSREPFIMTENQQIAPLTDKKQQQQKFSSSSD